MESPADYDIWDLHCHLSGVDGRTPGERLTQLLEVADRMHVERLLVFMGYPWSQEPDPAEFRRQNDQVVEALQRHPDRALGLAYINPAYPEESLAEMDRMIANGPMLGIKLWVAVRCNDPRLDPIVEHARRLKALIFQHTWYKTGGNLPGESSPADLAELAARHPDVPMICGHTGGNWELGIRAIRRSPNLLIGTGGFDPTAGITEMALRELGAQRIVYGSDVGGRSFSSQLAKILGARMTKADRQAILGGNLRRLLADILEAKGKTR